MFSFFSFLQLLLLLGVGMKKASDDDWISQQDDFNILLSQLNQGMCVFLKKKLAFDGHQIASSRIKWFVYNWQKVFI